MAAANAAADLMGRLLARPSPDPALLIDAGLRPEGRNGPLVRSLEAFRAYWQRFAQPWERQALLRPLQDCNRACRIRNGPAPTPRQQCRH